jgi:hypothetical protein
MIGKIPRIGLLSPRKGRAALRANPKTSRLVNVDMQSGYHRAAGVLNLYRTRVNPLT